MVAVELLQLLLDLLKMVVLDNRLIMTQKYYSFIFDNNIVRLRNMFYIFQLQEVITEEDSESSSDYVGESSDDEGSGGGSQSGASVKPGVDLDIGTTLKRILDLDHDLITSKNKVIPPFMYPRIHISIIFIIFKISEHLLVGCITRTTNRVKHSGVMGAAFYYNSINKYSRQATTK